MSVEQDRARALELEPSSAVKEVEGLWLVTMSWMGSPMGEYGSEVDAWAAARRIAEARANYAPRSPSMPVGERTRAEPSRLAAGIPDKLD